MLKVITYNCQGLKNSLQDVSKLCQYYEYIFLQKTTWLLILIMLSSINKNFEGFGISAIDDSLGIVKGRPYGGMAILVRKRYRGMIEFQQYKDPRILGITVKYKSELYFLLSVYMPYQCLDNQELYMDYIGKICVIVEYSSTSNVIVLGDFNADVNTLFESELIAMCDTLNLTISGYLIFGRFSGQFTHVSDAHNTTSWLDHVICSQDIKRKLVFIDILDRLPSSDHLPLYVMLEFNCEHMTAAKHVYSKQAKLTCN